MQGKRGLIMGLANDRSLAWGIARALGDQGAELAFSYQGEALEKRVRPLAARARLRPAGRLRRQSDMKALDTTFDAARRSAGTALDFVVHAIGFSDKNELRGKFVDTVDGQFPDDHEHLGLQLRRRRAARAGDDEPRRFAADADLLRRREGHPALQRHGRRQGRRSKPASNISPTDLGPEGIRVNAISAGPIKTLAASGIGDFRYIMKWNEYNSPLRRNVTIEDVGGAGLYLLSDLASGVTGEIHHVDAGYNVVGMKAEDAPDIATV